MIVWTDRIGIDVSIRSLLGSCPMRLWRELPSCCRPVLLCSPFEADPSFALDRKVYQET